MEDEMKRSINDLVDDVVIRLWENESFAQHVRSPTPIEGSRKLDEILAARMIRDADAMAGGTLLANEKLATIVRAMRVVLRRYGQGRKAPIGG
jgi:hypothetical protein